MNNTVKTILGLVCLVALVFMASYTEEQQKARCEASGRVAYYVRDTMHCE